MTESKKKLETLLKETRVEKKLSLRGVEKQTGISFSYLSQLESGQRNGPRLDVLYRLFKFYKLPLGELREYSKCADAINLAVFGQVAKNINMNLNKKKEMHLLKGFSNLSEKGKDELVDFLDYLLKKEQRS